MPSLFQSPTEPNSDAPDPATVSEEFVAVADPESPERVIVPVADIAISGLNTSVSVFTKFWIVVLSVSDTLLNSARSAKLATL